MDDITLAIGGLFADDNDIDAMLSEDDNDYTGVFADDSDDRSLSSDDTSTPQGQTNENVSNPEQPEVPVTSGINTGMRDQFREYLEHQVPKNDAFTSDEEVAIKLLAALRVKQVALKGYEEIMAWHLKESGMLQPHETIHDSPHYIPRETLLQRLKVRYNYENKFPVKQQVKLPVSGSVIHLTLHDVTAVIQGLLTEPRIQDADYFFFDDDPMAPPPESATYIREFQTGKAFSDTYAMEIDPDSGNHEQLLGIPLYLDGAAISHFHDLEIIQVKITIGFWNRQTRTKEYAWATIGYIEKVHEQGGKGREVMRESRHVEVQDGNDSEDEADARILPGVGSENAQDFHAMIDCILEGLVDLQEHGFIWDFAYKGKLYKDVHFKIFVPFVKCDNQEADKLAGKYLARGHGVKQLCRACHVSLEEANDHLHKPVYKTVGEVRNLVQEARLEDLKAISQCYLLNGFHKVKFNQGNDRGIHGACPYDMLHCLQLGIFLYLRDIFFKELGKTSKVSEVVNGLSQEYCKHFSRQSDRSIPKCNFSKGIKAGKLMGREYRGVLIIMLAILRSTAGQEIMRGSRKKRIASDVQVDDWILLVETLLQWETYLNQDQMLVSDVQRLKRKHRYIMYLMRRVAKRTEGMQMNFIKFHLIIHLYEDIILYGIPLEFDTSANESHHKASKQAAKRTQKATSTFNFQTATRLTEYRLIELALLEIEEGKVVWKYFADCKGPEVEGINPEEEVGSDMEDVSSSVEEGSDNSSQSLFIYTGETQLQVYLDDGGDVQYQIKSRSKFKDKTLWNEHLVEWLYALQDLISGDNADYSLPIYTCHKRGDQIFRGHPNYRGLGKWNDWVWVKWGGEGKLPCHIWCFVTVVGLDQRRRRLNYGGIPLKDGTYAVVEVAELQEDEVEMGRSSMLVPFMKEVDLDGDGTVVGRHFYLANTEAFEAPCCCVPDIGGPPNRYFAMRTRSLWAEDFMVWLRDNHNLDKMDELDGDDNVVVHKASGLMEDAMEE